MQTFLVDTSKAILVAMALMVSYQFALIQYNASQFVFYAPRIDFVSANREGLFSLIGYFSMQIIGIGLGRLLYEEMLDPPHLKTLKAGNKDILPLFDNIGSFQSQDPYNINLNSSF